jgi:hypothetical protein
MNGIATVYKDDKYAILICRDGVYRLVVQLVSYIPQQLMNADNILEEHLAARVMETKEILVSVNGHVNQQLKNQLSEAISYMQKQLALYNQIDEHIAGALKDYEQHSSR